MDGEVAQLAALVISANHRISNPADPMAWFADQRAFASCGRIGFRAAEKRRFGKPRHVPVAETPSHWLELLTGSGVKRVVMSCTRQDDGPDDPEDTLPDRLAAGFAGGGSLWRMSTETQCGGALCWQPGWRAAFPRAEDGRIWATDYMAEPCEGGDPGPSVKVASDDLHAALIAAETFATEHQFTQVAAIFASALCLLQGDADPRPVPRPPGPADTLADPARRLLNAAQRGWIFDNMGLWKDQDFSPELWQQYAQVSETLYTTVTAAITAAVNSSISKP